MSDLSVEIWERSGGLAADRGGYFPTTWGWGVVPLCWVAVMALFVRDHISLSRLELAFLGVLIAIPGWYAVSIARSHDVPQSILEVQRALLYPAGVLAVLLVTRRSTTRHLLTGPITYWNALGIYSAVGTLVAAALATTGRSIVARALSAATLPVLVPTMYLTFSRGAWIAMAIGLLGAVAVAPKRLTVITGILALAPAPAIAVIIASRSGALSHLQSSLARAQHEGHRMALAVAVLAVVSAGVGVAITLAERRPHVSARARRASAGALGAVGIAVVVAAFVHFGNPVSVARNSWDSFTGPPVQVTSNSNLNKRLFTLSSNGRIDIWAKAIDAFAEHPLSGVGGGSFERYWNQHRNSDLKVVDAHSLYVEVLAELGPLGLLLFVALVGLPLVAGIRRRHDPWCRSSAARSSPSHSMPASTGTGRSPA